MELTYRLFLELIKHFKQVELKLIDITIKMYSDPVLVLDTPLLEAHLEDVRQRKERLLEAVNQDRESLMSNQKFAELLIKCAVVPPMKISPTTGKETYAFAKTDQGFIDLQGHDDLAVQQLCAVRLGTKSTLEESRIERFIGIGSRNRGRIPVPLKYYGAHTGRWSGSDSVNFQNLPSRDKQKKTLKNAILAPENHVLINSDSSQIEARVLAWLSGQDDLVEQFRNGEDVYSTFATKVFNKPVSKATPMERFVGKTCILGLGYGTGAAKLQQTLALGNAELSLDECKRIVDLYRTDNYRIKELWRECDNALQQMMHEGSASVGVLETPCNSMGIQLPNGLYIRYPSLRIGEEERIIYDSRRGPVSIWGGAMVENIVQALARIIIGEQMLKIAERYKVVLTVHDAVVLCVPEEQLEEAVKYVNICMSTPPAWCKNLPVTCESKWGASYGDC